MANYNANPRDGVAWVTGASSGIGAAVAKALAREGFTVIATARREDKLAEVARGEGGRIIPMPCDVTDEAAMAATLEKIVAAHGVPALALFNAGVFLPVHGEDLEVRAFNKTFDVNLKGVVNGLVPVIRSMQAAGRGHVAIVSSVTGYGGLPTSAAYGASKAALTNLAESLKFDLDKMNIRIQSIHPGFVDTPATRKNEFPMPALMKVEDAADRIVAGLKGNVFEITFPRRLTYALKFAGLFPYAAYFAIINRFTGWKKRPLRMDR